MTEFLVKRLAASKFCEGQAWRGSRRALPWRRRSSQAVVDRRAEALAWNWSHCDASRAALIESTKKSEEVGRRLGQVAARRQVETRRGVGAAQRAGEIERRLV